MIRERWRLIFLTFTHRVTLASVGDLFASRSHPLLTHCPSQTVNKSTAAHDPPFFASVRRSHFSGSMWHISVGTDVKEVSQSLRLSSSSSESLHRSTLFQSDVLALEAANDFTSVHFGENVTRHNKDWFGGIIQPWRSGAVFNRR